MYKIKKEILLPYSILLLVSIFISLPLFQKGIDMYRDDGIQHITRLMGMVQTIMEGQFPPMVMSTFCNGFGYSWNLFYSPLSAYTPLIFILVGCSYIGSIKGFLFLMLFLSGVSMYAFTKKVTGHTGVALIAATLYLTMPYHINDIYNRVAIAEVASFVFLPMVFHGLYKLLHKEGIAVLVVGAVGMLLSHTVLTFYTAIMALIYLLVGYKQIDKATIQQMGIATLLILALTSFFWEPMLESRLATQYEVFQPGRMSELGIQQQQRNPLIDRITWKDLIKDDNVTGSYSLNVVLLLGLVAMVSCVSSIRKLPYQSLYWTFLALGIGSLLMSLWFFPFDKLPEIFKLLQFRFRMLEFVAFFLSFIAAVNIGLLWQKNKKRQPMLYIGMLICIVVFANPVVQRWNNPYDIEPEELYWPAVPVTEKTGKVHIGCASFEYLPSKAYENRTYIVERSDQPVMVAGNADITSFEKQGAKARMQIERAEGATIEFPYIYYIGYTVTWETTTDIQILATTESEKGFLQVTLPDTQEEATLQVRYTGTTGMQIAYSVTACTILGIGIWCMRRKFKKNMDKIVKS